MMRLVVAALVALCAARGLAGASEPKSGSDSKVDISKAEAVISTKKVNQQIFLMVETPAGTHLNFDGPWKLRVDGNIPFKSGLKFELGKESFDQKAKRFALDLEKPVSAGANAIYTITYFLCDDAKTWCRRLQAKGDFN